MKMINITLKNITKTFNQGGSAVRAVDNVSMEVGPGEFFFLLGPSGCGKTTLLRIVAGLTAPTSGQVLLGGRDVTCEPVERRQTAMVFQSYALWPHMTVFQNVEFGPKVRGLEGPLRRQIAIDSLRRVQMENYTRRKPNQLSGGQQQRVALARALAGGGKCLLLDEPLSNLDARLRLIMRIQLRQLVKDTHVTALYVTHDQKEALSMADRIAVMNAGRIVQTGTPRELYDRPATRFVADFLGEANFISGSAGKGTDQAAVDTPAGMLVSSSSFFTPGQKVTCCIRPERIVAVPMSQKTQAQGVNQLPAAVASIIYLGEVRQYICRLSSGDLWKVTTLADPAKPMPEGSQVLLVIQPDDVILLPPSED